MASTRGRCGSPDRGDRCPRSSPRGRGTCRRPCPCSEGRVPRPPLRRRQARRRRCRRCRGRSRAPPPRHRGDRRRRCRPEPDSSRPRRGGPRGASGRWITSCVSGGARAGSCPATAGARARRCGNAVAEEDTERSVMSDARSPDDDVRSSGRSVCRPIPKLKVAGRIASSPVRRGRAPSASLRRRPLAAPTSFACVSRRSRSVIVRDHPTATAAFVYAVRWERPNSGPSEAC